MIRVIRGFYVFYIDQGYWIIVFLSRWKNHLKTVCSTQIETEYCQGGPSCDSHYDLWAAYDSPSKPIFWSKLRLYKLSCMINAGVPFLVGVWSRFGLANFFFFLGQSKSTLNEKANLNTVLLNSHFPTKNAPRVITVIQTLWPSLAPCSMWKSMWIWR